MTTTGVRKNAYFGKDIKTMMKQRVAGKVLFLVLVGDWSDFHLIKIY